MFADGTLRVWRAYDIGQGKSIVFDSAGQCFIIFFKKNIIYRHFYRKNANKHSGCIYKKMGGGGGGAAADSKNGAYSRQGMLV